MSPSLPPPRTITAVAFAQIASHPGLPLLLRTDLPVPDWERIAWRHEDFHSLYVVLRGRGTHVIDGVAYAIARGDVYAMTAGQTHFLTHCEQLAMTTLHFLPSALDEAAWQAVGGTIPGGKWLHLTPSAHAAAGEMLAELQAEWRRANPAPDPLCRALLLRLLAHLARLRRSGEPAPRSTGAEEAVAEAVRFLDERFAEPVRIEQAAQRAFLSPDRFTEVFRNAMGQTPRDYLRYVRIERAKALLATTDDSIARVALQAGFSDAAYLARVFRAATGLTPRQWRVHARRT